MSRVGNFEEQIIDRLKKMLEIGDEEMQFAKTPCAYGGLGALELGQPKYAVEQISDQRAYFGVVKQVGGYSKALSITEKQIGRNLQKEGLGAAEAALRFTKLPKKVAERVKKNYYNLRRSGKGIDIRKKDSVMRKQNMFKMAQKPRAKIRAYWPALQQFFDMQRALWDQESKESFSAIKHAGAVVAKKWEKGELKITINYSKRLSAEALAEIAQKQTDKLLVYLASHRGKDIKADTLREIMWELEVYGHDEANSQINYYICR